MEFQITVTTSGKKYKMDVRRTNLMPDSERWEVRARNHTFLLDCNRPLMEKKNLPQLAWDWKLVAGKCPEWFLKEIQQEIRRTISWLGRTEK